MGKLFGRLRLNHVAVIKRATITAVKTDITIPIAKVTAKPLTGPDPTKYRVTAAIKVVIFASKIYLT